jgi:uncharacterized protein (TIGR03435 family)
MTGLILLMLLQVPTHFDAASIKPVTFYNGIAQVRTIEPTRIRLQMPLAMLISEAYDVPQGRVMGNSPLLRGFYEVDAVVQEPVSQSQALALLRQLLVDRFHLQAHRENRVVAAERLEVGPGGLKMKSTPTGYTGANSPSGDECGLTLNGPMSMAQLAESLTRFGDGKPVVDATSLEGYFTINLKFSSGTANPACNVLNPPLDDALKNQLGLKLAPMRIQLTWLFVDNVAPPTAN